MGSILIARMIRKKVTDELIEIKEEKFELPTECTCPECQKIMNYSNNSSKYVCTNCDNIMSIDEFIDYQKHISLINKNKSNIEK